ncbi:hypothetical protein C8J57DRAFT_1244938 [Mycena rebaudengoi]|nr:hypothetical protein C8J57DRAFT_1250984 [Mycena rebaudengoi]KAJ7241117.1 hypothetical protein C8J57DRAFT_1244938 [Mycena rebaudengoi]
MSRVPSKVIAAIVQQVEHTTSLNLCSLAGSAFRSPCQRILLRSMTLKVDPPNYTAARSFLDDSPHVAAYITRLHIWVPPPSTANSELESLMQILDRLENLLLCEITAPSRWSGGSKLRNR